MNSDIKTILNKLMSEGASKEEAIAEFKDMRRRVWEGEDPEEVLYDIGLEPDYVFGLIG